MKNGIKKSLSIILSLIMILTVFSVNAFAGNGPRPNSGYIGFSLPMYNEDPNIPYMAVVFERGEMGVPIDGVSYDLDTNTLTLDNYNMPYSLGIVSMGDDFKINLVGNNSLDNIYLSDGQGNGCSVTFTGTGSLVVNEDQNARFALAVYPSGMTRPTVTFDRTVNVTLYSGAGEDGGIAAAETVLDSDANPAPPVFVFANGQQVNVDMQDTLIFDGEIEGYTIRKMDGGYRWFGKQISNPDDPDGLYTYNNYGHWDSEAEEWVDEGYQVEKLKVILDGVYTNDYDYEGEKFDSEEALLAAYPVVTAMVQDENPATLNNRVTIATHTSAARIYKDSDDNTYAYSHCWNPDTEESGDYVCEYTEIPELPGQYVVTPINGKTLDGLTYTGEDVGAYSLRDDGYPSSCGNIIDVETPEGTMYTATLITDETDPDNPHTDWHVQKYVYSSDWDLWFQDYSFGENGEIEINPQDFETSEWNAFIYEEREQQVEIKSNYDANSFYGSICEDGEGHCCAIERWADLNDEETVLYDYEDVNGTIIFTENTTFDKANFHVNDSAHIAEGVHDYFIFGQKLTVSSTGWANASSQVTLSKLTNAKNGINVQWQALAGADGYIVYRKAKGESSWANIGKVTGENTVSFVDTKAAAGTQYSYTVKAYKGTVYSKYNTTGISTVRLANPAFKLSNAKDGVKIAITKAAGATGYYVYRKTGTGSFAKIGTTTSLSYVDKTAKAGTKYTYAVKSYNGSASSAYNSADIVRLANASVKLSNTTAGIKVAWGKVAGAKGYYVYRKTGSGSFTKIATTTSLSYVDKTAKAGTKYTYAVKAYNGSYTSAYNEVSIVRLTTPSVKIANTKSGPKATWGKVTGAKGYYVYRKTANGSYAKIATIKSGTTVSYVDKTAKSGTKYYYAIKAYNGSYVSAYTNTGITCKK